MDWPVFFTLFLFVAAALALFSGESKVLGMLFTGSGDFPNEAGRYNLPWQARLGVFAALLIGVAAIVVSKSALIQINEDFDRKSSAAQQAKIDEDNKKRDERTNKRFADMEAKLSAMRVLAWEDHRRAYIGEVASKLGSIPAKAIEIHVDQADEYDEYVFVVHLLPEVAYWKLKSSNLFVDKRGEIFDFLARLAEADVRSEFLKYEMVAGIGLDSRTTDQDPQLSMKRSRTLCKGIADAVAGSKSTSALGLSIGTYTGPEVESESRPDSSQRTVAIMGVVTGKAEVELTKVVSKVLKEIRYHGIDLSLYSGLRNDGEVQWVSMTDCVRPPANRTRH
jgi:hypothetical protein